MTLSHAKRFDMSKHAADVALVQLYELLKAGNAPEPGSFSTLSQEERREYFRLARQRSRAREREAAASGAIKPTTANVRAALADAALMLLATGGPGADHVRQVLTGVFKARPGAPLSIERRARTGKLRPKLVRTQ